MPLKNLDALFQPKSVVLVGATPNAGKVGYDVFLNLTRGNLKVPLYLVNPNHTEIEGRSCHADVAALPVTPDLGIIASPAETVPGILRALGVRGTRAAVIVSTGLTRGDGELAAEAVEAARETGLRLLGPDSIGVMVPAVGLKAPPPPQNVPKGDLALISQSGSVIGSMVEWANGSGVGFSAIASVGNSGDVDVGDLLDYFSLDYRTRAILLYMEGVGNASRFMTAARAAARVRPVVVIKSGRHKQAAIAAATHSGALATADAVYDAAFRRAGLLRVRDLHELFEAAQTLSLLKPFKGRRLAVVTNGGGMGVVAVDRLVDYGGHLACLGDETHAALDAFLPCRWSGANPIDIGDDADPERYGKVLDIVLQDADIDAALVMHCPSMLGASVECAEAAAEAVGRHRKNRIHPKPVFAAWLSHDDEARTIFEAEHVPCYPSPSGAIRGYMDLVHYSDAQDELMATPPSLPSEFRPDVESARAAVAGALADNRAWLAPLETQAVLAAYDIPMVQTEVARTPEEARLAARKGLTISNTCAVKVASPDIPNKSDVRGVVLDVTTPEVAELVASEMLLRIPTMRPDARIDGVSIQPMIVRRNGVELVAGIADDPVFGPVVVFGRGGLAVEVIADKALPLPPLDMHLAHDLIAQTRVSRVLKGYRGRPAADENAVALTLVKLAQLSADIPEIRSLDLNPLVADDSGVLSLDARIAVKHEPARVGGWSNPRFAIRPYPKQWERQMELRDGSRVDVRPIRPEDEVLYPDFFARVTPEDLRLRFFAPVRDFSHKFIARLTQIDYSRDMAFLALDEATGELMGVVRLSAEPDRETGEYAILLRSDLKGKGLGWRLMKLLIEYARSEGFRSIHGQVLRENTAMLSMCEGLGFHAKIDPDEPNIAQVKLPLDEPIADTNGEAPLRRSA